MALGAWAGGGAVQGEAGGETVQGVGAPFESAFSASHACGFCCKVPNESFRSLPGVSPGPSSTETASPVSRFFMTNASAAGIAPSAPEELLASPPAPTSAGRF